jgi:succinate dehydrogenase/fumarate reductase flavoprotein subunit
MKDPESIQTDVLIIGAGAAGMRAAAEAAAGGVDVIMLSKGTIGRSGASFANLSGGWGIQALTGEERTGRALESFYRDIIQAGLGCCDPKLVRILVEESGDRLKELMDLGVCFRKHTNGTFIRVKGCFSETERAFLTESLDNVSLSFLSKIQHSPVKIIQGYPLELSIKEGSCRGARALTEQGAFLKISAKSTILATGGGGALFRHHLVPEDATGSGTILAHRAGARLINMEFIQFMLGFRSQGERGFVPLQDLKDPLAVTDARGNPLFQKWIQDRDLRRRALDLRQTHYPFSCRDDSGLIDLAVSSERKHGGKVYWKGNKGYPGPLEIQLSAHAFNGGIRIDEQGRTGIPGLFAAGEAAGGPHGADRVGGCMMTATQVFGRRAGLAVVQRAKKVSAVPEMESSFELNRYRRSGKEKARELKEMGNLIRHDIQKALVIQRSEKELLRLILRLETHRKEIECMGWNRPEDLKPFAATHGMAELGVLIARQALLRKQGLGSHSREETGQLKSVSPEERSVPFQENASMNNATQCVP